MAVPKYIRTAGNHLKIVMDDGSQILAYKSISNLWIAKAATGGGTDPGGGDPGGGDPGSNPGFIQPFDPDAYDASDPFGASPGAIRNHFGSDYNGLPEGTPIRAISDGTVVGIDFEPGNGNHLVVHAGVYSGREIYWAYIHLQSLPTLSIGSHVYKGQPGIALLGNTGSNSAGAHLHITMSSSEGAWGGTGGIFDPHHFIETGEFIDRNW